MGRTNEDIDGGVIMYEQLFMVLSFLGVFLFGTLIGGLIASRFGIFLRISKKEDYEEIYNLMRPYAAKKKVQDSPEPLWNLFISCIRENLHIILCMSPVGELLRVRCRKFPSLINCCSLDWFPNWPR